MLGSVLADRIKIYFSDHDLASIEIVARNPWIGRLGVVQVLRADSTVVEQDRFQDATNSIILIRVPAGAYEIRVRLLTIAFLLARRHFDRGSSSRFSDTGLVVPELFADDEFVRIPAGQFTRGDPQFKVASPPHELFLSEFRIRSIPVTFCEYSAYLASERYAQSDDIGVCSGKDATKPAVYINWDEAKRFCAWVSKLKGQSYRLPTEAEYERAMRISGANQQYPWGNTEFDPEKPHIPLANYLEYWRGRTTPEGTQVRAFPSVHGLYDIAGDVWEWTSDWYDPQFYKRDESRVPDCRGPRASTLNQVVVRGGSFGDPLQKLSCAFRGGVDPAVGYYNVGFRLVK
jgi:formylglycine-generating enzyme required for sulfatase activity